MLLSMEPQTWQAVSTSHTARDFRIKRRQEQHTRAIQAAVKDCQVRAPSTSRRAATHVSSSSLAPCHIGSTPSQSWAAAPWVGVYQPVMHPSVRQSVCPSILTWLRGKAAAPGA